MHTHITPAYQPKGGRTGPTALWCFASSHATAVQTVNTSIIPASARWKETHRGVCGFFVCVVFLRRPPELQPSSPSATCHRRETDEGHRERAETSESVGGHWLPIMQRAPQK